MCCSHLMRKRVIDGERRAKKKEGVDLRVTAATEDDSGKAQLGSYSDACCIQNNTITCNHSLNCYPGD